MLDPVSQASGSNVEMIGMFSMLSSVLIVVSYSMKSVFVFMYFSNSCGTCILLTSLFSIIFVSRIFISARAFTDH